MQQVEWILACSSGQQLGKKYNELFEEFMRMYAQNLSRNYAIKC
jgi:hypothetical protein